ncbi:MAG: hypothetical protein M3O15_16280, partial [Acidobacteriota bacterium]|nr:hypothetical protein [Acidobacteriota bacterium]
MASWFPRASFRIGSALTLVALLSVLLAGGMGSPGNAWGQDDATSAPPELPEVQVTATVPSGPVQVLVELMDPPAAVAYAA